MNFKIFKQNTKKGKEQQKNTRAFNAIYLNFLINFNGSVGYSTLLAPVQIGRNEETLLPNMSKKLFFPSNFLPKCINSYQIKEQYNPKMGHIH